MSPVAQSDLKELRKDPRFQNLLAKAETHQYKFRPEESKKLKAQGKLKSVLEQRTLACWEQLKAARQSGMNMMEAQEVALPTILLPSEDGNDLGDKDDLDEAEM